MAWQVGVIMGRVSRGNFTPSFSRNRAAIEVFDEGAGQSKQIALFPEDRLAPALDCDVVSIRLSAMRLRRPRQWGACWMATLLWDQLRLDEFWLAALPPSREGTSWAPEELALRKR